MSANDRRAYWLQFHQECLKSGEVVSEFCRSRGVKGGTYRQAVSRYGFKGKVESKPKFIELTQASEARHCLVEVEYRDFTIRLFSQGDVELFAETLKRLEELS